jgi:polyisoprenoid-binding protein YceI
MRVLNCCGSRKLVLETAIAGLSLVSIVFAAADTREPIDTEQSTITLHVGKSGVFRAFGDTHEIRGPVTQGFVDENASTVDIVIDARHLRVLDPNSAPEDREAVQTRMLGTDVLDVSRYPEIHFTSTSVDRTGQEWTVHGQLTLHGQTRPAIATVTRQGDHYKGSARLKQTEFGITPVTVAGGAVKVKDEVTLDFDIVTRGARPQPGTASER